MGMTIKFYMSSGQIITINGVKTIKMIHNNQTGNYTEYQIVWHDKYKPEFFSLNLNCIEAVISE